MARTGRGFTNPVVRRPHLSPGVEVFDEQVSEDNGRWTDPVSEDLVVAPSQTLSNNEYYKGT